MFQAGDPVNISLWTKDGQIQHWNNCIPLRYDFYKGVRRMKLLTSRQIRQVRDVCIFRINGMDFFCNFVKLILNQMRMRYWLFPGNKNRFRLDDFIKDYGFIEWNPLRYKNHIQVGDIVFIYVGAPSKRICYQMSVEKVNIPFNEWFDDRSYKIPPSNVWSATPDELMVRLKLIKKVNSPFLTFQFLNENGLSGANWIREIKDENLLKYILKHI